MSYSIIHMEKFKMGSARGINNHNERLKKSLTNPDIDYSKSHLNKKLDNQPINKSYHNRIKDRIKELNLPKAIRQDAVAMCGFVCTSDNKFFDKLSQEDKDRFFQECYNFLKTRYGENNIISANVHYDETTPHMHYYMVPVTPDGRLSAKSLFTRNELRKLQTDFNKHLKEVGFNLERGKEGSELAHVSELRYKVEMEKVKLDNLEQTKETLKDEIEVLKENKKELTSKEVESIQGEKNLLGGLKGVSYKEYEQLKATALKVDETIKEATITKFELSQMKEKMQEELKKSPTLTMQAENQKLKLENEHLKEELRRSKNLLNSLWKIIKTKLPKFYEDKLKRLEGQFNSLINEQKNVIKEKEKGN